MNKKECPICKQISETPFCPYCGTKLQLTGEEGELKEKEDLKLALEEAIAIAEEAITFAEGENLPTKISKKRLFF
jgi:hypothetical protein